ncbi:MAG: hypothetical protein JXA52_09725 [Planctomycetes bacterium]|nr:hypothetical protein [Planctomycetota bacterium]
MGTKTNKHPKPGREERIVDLLRRLAATDDQEESKEIHAELAAVTGVELEGGLSRWLNWYIEEHLGIHSVLEVLTGRDPSIISGESTAAFSDGDIFLRPEYNWCALERIDNRDDMIKLRQVYSDLESPIQIEEEGAFSFARLTGLSADEMEYFRNKSLSEVLFDENTHMEHLRVLKDYGKIMMLPVLPSATQRSGAIVYAAAIAQALTRFDIKISTLTYQSLAESLENLVDRPYLVESYTNLFKNALKKCR